MYNGKYTHTHSNLCKHWSCCYWFSINVFIFLFLCDTFEQSRSINWKCSQVSILWLLFASVWFVFRIVPLRLHRVSIMLRSGVRMPMFGVATSKALNGWFIATLLVQPIQCDAIFHLSISFVRCSIAVSSGLVWSVYRESNHRCKLDSIVFKRNRSRTTNGGNNLPSAYR